jgi:tetratricopeptide (TPR) repeat protein
MSGTLINVAGVGLLTLLLGLTSWITWGRMSEPGRGDKRFVRTLLSTLAVLITFGVAHNNLGPNAASGDPLPVVAACVLCGFCLCVAWTADLATLLAHPIAGLFDGAGASAPAGPLYSIAEARRKRGQFHEAIAEIQRQLERYPDDPRGTLMIASIQAESLRDPAAACNTLEGWIAAHPSHAAGIALALHQLAEIHLHNQDPAVARATLERLVALAPESEAAHLARQRIAHLASRDQLLERLHPAPIRVGQYEQRVGLRDTPLALVPPVDPRIEVAKLLQHLERYPEDAEARESLAMKYGQELAQPDLAEKELETLIGNSHASDAQVARWLNLLCDLQLRQGRGQETAQLTLQRIIERFPKSAAAARALQRIPLLHVQAGANHASQPIPLGPTQPPPERPPRR